MALGTVRRAFPWSGAVLLMAPLALLMEGVGLFRILRILDIGSIVTIQAAFGNNPFLRIGQVTLAASDQGLFIIRRVVMAIKTVKAIPVCG